MKMITDRLTAVEFIRVISAVIVSITKPHFLDTSLIMAPGTRVQTAPRLQNYPQKIGEKASRRISGRRALARRR
ncbi:hypothetical protein NECAME_19093 [Necator americanus]|uniref:Uncharacterized protein n=1 Tax=Necator americanus TaxID=51031 RepID=W2SQE7_NECAM|nr:hypothetical protein NECAME_19093 [Necator americanus]ETN71949.1 hypothetical protein NECAME_19093 [Necator americanus]